MGRMRTYVTDGWNLSGAAISFVLGNRPLKRFLLGALGAMVLIAAAVAAAGVLLRRHAGPVEYVLVGVAVSYCLNLIVTAVAVGAAGLVADSLEGHPVSASTGWETMRRRRRPIAGGAVAESRGG